MFAVYSSKRLITQFFRLNSSRSQYFTDCEATDKKCILFILRRSLRVESVWLTGQLISILTEKVAVKGFKGLFGLTFIKARHKNKDLSVTRLSSEH